MQNKSLNYAVGLTRVNGVEEERAVGLQDPETYCN